MLRIAATSRAIRSRWSSTTQRWAESSPSSCATTASTRATTTERASTTLRFARIPDSNELGTLQPDDPVSQTIDLGDLDTYVFDVTAGYRIDLQVTELSGSSFQPRIELYAPDGTQLAAESQVQGSVPSVTAFADVAGAHTALVRDGDASGRNGTGSYEILLTLTPPTIPIPAWAALLLWMALLGVGSRRAERVRPPNRTGAARWA